MNLTDGAREHALIPWFESALLSEGRVEKAVCIRARALLGLFITLDEASGTITFTRCHPERPRRSIATERESKDPEDVSLTHAVSGSFNDEPLTYALAQLTEASRSAVVALIANCQLPAA